MYSFDKVRQPLSLTKKIKMYKIIKKQYNSQVPSLGLALFRILFFGFIFFHILNEDISLLNNTSYSATFKSFWLVSVFFIAIGFKYDFFKWINYLLTALFINQLELDPASGIQYLLSIATVSLFIPFNKYLSFDYITNRIQQSTLKKDIIPTSSVRAINYDFIFIFALLFFNVAPLISAIQSELTSDNFFISILSINNPPSIIIQVICLFVYWVSLLGLFWRKIRTLIILVYIPLLIIGFISTPQYYDFWIVNIIIIISLIPYEIQNRILSYIKSKKESNNKKIIFYYDGECPLCFRTKTIISSLDIFGRIEFKRLQVAYYTDDILKKHDLNLLYNDVYAVSIKKQKLVKGIYTYIEVFKAFPLTKIMGLLISISPFINIGKAIYKTVASSREVERCSEENCELPSAVQSNSSKKVKLFKNLSLEDFNRYCLNIAVTSLLLLIISSNLPFNSNTTERIDTNFLKRYIGKTPILKDYVSMNEIPLK